MSGRRVGVRIGQPVGERLATLGKHCGLAWAPAGGRIWRRWPAVCCSVPRCTCRTAWVSMALPVLAAGVPSRRVRPLLTGRVGVALIVAAFTAAGSWWLDGYELVVQRYYQGIADERPCSYRVRANAAALVLAAGPAAAAGLGSLGRTDRVVRYLVLAAVLVMIVADLSGLSRAETERIWLPFAVGLTAGAVVLGNARLWLAVQAFGRIGGQPPGADEVVRSMSERVLVVDDDPTVADVVRRYLERDGYQVALAADGETALRLASEREPDLVVLDLMLPGIDGLEVCRQLRSHWNVPIVMLTALGEEADRIMGLQLGADDYVTKPFSPRELALRVAAVLRRARASTMDSAAPALLRDGSLEVDTTARRGLLRGVELALTVRELDLLAFLLQHAGQAFSRPELLERVWGWTFGDHSTVTVHVRRLREKVEDDPAQPRRIVTVWGVGYRYDRQD